MTREEKINLLKAIILECEEYQWWRKATLSEIIEDLEYELCEDAVSRKAVDHLCFEFLRANSDDNIAFYEHFRDLPSVTPTTRWIPCSERLPEEGKEVLVCCYDTYGKKITISRYKGERYGFACGLVSAWMPLPEPYKAEMEGEE
jgi:hypothetical protein